MGGERGAVHGSARAGPHTARPHTHSLAPTRKEPLRSPAMGLGGAPPPPPPSTGPALAGRPGVERGPLEETGKPLKWCAAKPGPPGVGAPLEDSRRDAPPLLPPPAPPPPPLAEKCMPRSPCRLGSWSLESARL